MTGLFTALAAASLVLGCASTPDTVCQLVSDAVVVPSSSGLPSEGPSGSTIVTSLVRPTSDAGSFGIPVSADIAILGSDGTLTADHSFPAPTGLASRKGSTSDVGADWTGQGALFHWSEAASQTQPDGTDTFTQTVKAQFVGLGGQQGTVLALPDAGCQNCRLSTSSVALPGGGVAILYTMSPVGSGQAVPSFPFAAFATVSADGALLRSGAVSWLLDALAAQSPDKLTTAQLRTSGDDLLLATTDEVWQVDASLMPLAGPIAIGGKFLAWHPAEDDAALVWPDALAVRLTVGHDPANGVGVLPDIYFQRSDNAGRPKTDVQRVATGLVYAVGQSGDDYAVFFAGDNNQDYLALVTAGGAKVGGDLSLGAAAAEQGFLVRAGGAGRFIEIFVVPEGVRRREVSCAP